MFATLQDATQRQRSASHSTDDHSITERPRRLFQRHAHDLSVSLDSSLPPHDNIPTPSAPTHAIHVTSTQSTPVTSPSTGYSSLFPGSLYSVTSESAPSPEHRSDFGLFPCRSSAYSPVLGSTSSRSSQPVSPYSRFTSESDAGPALHIPTKNTFCYPSQRPSTAPHSPSVHPFTTPANISAEHHNRSHSRFAASIKSFLSRPTFASPSRFSLNSSIAPPESEPSPRSFHLLTAAGKWPMTARKSRPPNLEISGSVAATAMSSPIQPSSPPIDAHRRYASEAISKIYNAKTGSHLPTSQDSLDLSIQNVSSVVTPEREPKTRNVLRRRPSGSAKLLKNQERGATSTLCPHERDIDQLCPLPNGISRLTDVTLTPAGAVVEAYKQQELHRDDKSTLPKLSLDAQMNSRASYYNAHDRERPVHSSTLFYASSSERHTQQRGSDDPWGKPEVDQLAGGTSRPVLSHQPSISDPGHRSLTRKVSTKLRKTKGAVTPEESPVRDRVQSKGRTSLREIWGDDKSGTRPTGRSMDCVTNTNDGAWSSSIEAHARPGSEKGSSEGGKIWRLMRRLSTGGLRDRFQSDRVVPPVPAIPKELLDKVNQNERSNEPVSTSLHQPSSSPRDENRIDTALQNITSVAITSSSSNSSDVASTHFFHKTHSARSSISSYGEAAGASHSKETRFVGHIIAPLEQLRLGEDHADADKPRVVPRSPRRSASVPAGMRKAEDTEGELVPSPSPRCQTSSGGPPSPTPSISPVPGCVRASHQNSPVVRQSQMADGLVSLSPPPRPTRGSRRGGSTASSPSHSMWVKPDSSVGIEVGCTRQLDRTLSSQSDTTARPESPQPRASRDEDTSHTRTHFTYRELNGPRRPPLSEREKVDIWNDLLDRSDRAGGTLHINGTAELMSDSMRFSMHSEI